MNKKNILIIIITLIVSILIIGGFFYIKNIKKNRVNKTVNIVFTTDNNYKEYLKVAIKSAILNKNKDSVYNINILSVDLPKSENKKFKEFEEENVKINIIPLKIESISHVGNYKVINHVSRADLFKFFMPDIFNNYDKILYIDCDTLILKDLLELYNIDISRNYLAASYKHAPEQYWKKFLWRNYRYQQYDYNCGVMLMNLKKMRKDDLKTRLIDLKNKDFLRVLMTQSIFNEAIPTKNIKKISPIYNFYTRVDRKDFLNKEFLETYSPFLDKYKNYEDLSAHVVIAHFAGKIKPWNDPTINFADKWWYYAKMINKNWKPEPLAE
jgi:lipopolysaccharide biosynthesis glycosyltransferase